MEYQSTTTLNRIRKAQPCKAGRGKLLASLGKTKANDEPLTLLTVLNSNGLDDALWVLSYAMPNDRLDRHFQAWCAEQVLHIYEREYPDDNRIRAQIGMLKNDDASDDDRASARAAAGDAAMATSWDAARDAAGAAAMATSWDAAGAAAMATSWDAAMATSWDAKMAVERDTSWDVRAARAAERGKQERQLRVMLEAA